jgi:D-psicose/D-tagatose/L-ribulose 3-epimerase
MALNITYGVSTWLWTSPFTTASIQELFPKIAKMGFDVVEIAVEDPSLINIKEVKKALKLYGLKANICGAFGTQEILQMMMRPFIKTVSRILNHVSIFAWKWKPIFLVALCIQRWVKARMLSPELRK